MTTMRSAARTLSAVTSCDRCTERSTPWRAAAATASGGGGLPGAVKPTELTRTRFRESAGRSNAAANGLRQMLPRQTTSRDVKRGRRRSALRARCRHSRCKTRWGTRRSRARNSVKTHRSCRAHAIATDQSRRTDPNDDTLRRAASHRTRATAASSIQVSWDRFTRDAHDQASHPTRSRSYAIRVVSEIDPTCLLLENRTLADALKRSAPTRECTVLGVRAVLPAGECAK